MKKYYLIEMDVDEVTAIKDKYRVFEQELERRLADLYAYLLKRDREKEGLPGMDEAKAILLGRR